MTTRYVEVPPITVLNRHPISGRPNVVALGFVELFVLEEYDRLLDQGFSAVQGLAYILSHQNLDPAFVEWVTS